MQLRLSSVLFLAFSAASSRDALAAPQKLIVDTDMGFDVDDVVAVCLANSLHMNKKVELLAVLHNTGCALGIGGVSAIQNFYGHNNVTLGAWRGRFGSDCDTHFGGTFGQNQYLSKMIDRARGPVTDAWQVPTGVEAYRRVLAAAPDGSVNIASVGMTTNLADLLASGGDAGDPRSGYDLIAAKVAKIVYMDGGYNFGCGAGNLGDDAECRGTAQRALKMPPNVRLISSLEGEDPPIYTGAGLQDAHPPGSPCREALADWCCNPTGEAGLAGRLSWDPIAVMIAALDVGAIAEKEVNVGTQWTADEAGRESFFGSGTRNAQTAFADAETSPGRIREIIDAYVNQVPEGVPAPPTPTPVPPLPPGAKWTPASRANCYGPRDGAPAHGARDLESPAYASCGTMRLEECQARCAAQEDCTAVTVRNAGNGLIDCFRKADVVLRSCDVGTEYTTYINAAVAEAGGFNCYGPRGGAPAHGATDKENPVDSSCGELTVDACFAKCAAQDGCTAITWRRTDGDVGDCYRKADVVLGDCDRNTEFDTWLTDRA